MFGNIFSAVSGASLGTLFVKLTADSMDLVRGMNQAQSSIERSSAVMLKQVQLMAAGINVALVAVGAIAVREAMRFEDSFAGVRKTVNATESEFKELEAAFRGMSKQIPINVNEINKIAEAAGQLGIKKENIVEFTRVMAKMGTATNLTSDQAATSLARFANITQMSQKNFERLGSTLVALGNDGASTESEIMNMALRIAGAGHTVGMSESQILSFANALSSVGVEAEAGGTAISQAMIRMAKAVAQGGKELKAFSGAAGMSVAQFKKAFKEDAAGAVIAFIEGLKVMQDSGSDVFTFLERLNLDGARMTDVLTRASGAGNLFSRSLEVGSAAWEENNALAEEARKRFETFSSQLTISWNIIKDFLITIGQELVPVLRVLNQMLQEGMQGQNEFSSAFLFFKENAAPAFLKAIGLIGDAIYGWKLIVKAGEIAFLQMFLNVVEAARLMARLISTVVENMVANIITGINSAIKAVNVFMKVATPLAAQIKPIQFKLKLDTTALDDERNALVAALRESLAELATMTSKGSFSDRLQAAYEKVTQKVLESNKKIVEDTKKSIDAIVKMTPQEKDSKYAMSVMAGIGMPDAGINGIKGAGRLEDPRYGQLAAIKLEEDAAKEHLKVLEDLNKQELNLTAAVQQKKFEMIAAWQDRAKRLQEAQAQIVLQTAGGMFEDLSNIAAATAGKQSGIYKAMFAMSKAFAIADATVKIAQGIAAAASQSFPYNLVAMASVAAATSSIVSSIQSTQLEFGGAREKGGPVTPGKSFLVGEAGPELFSPGSRGNIIPNDQLGGGSSVKVVINNYTEAKAEITESNQNGERVIEVIIKRAKGEIAAEVRDGRGDVTKALEQTFNLRRGR